MPLNPQGLKHSLPVCEGQSHRQEQARTSSGPRPAKPVEATAAVSGPRPGCTSLEASLGQREAMALLPKELPGPLAGPPERFPPASSCLLGLEAPPLCCPGLGPWPPPSVDFRSKWMVYQSVLDTWALSRELSSAWGQLAVRLCPSSLQAPLAHAPHFGLWWRLQLPA